MPRGALPRTIGFLALAFVLVKTIQAICYPDPFIIGDTEEYIVSAMTLEANPYKPMGYSLFLKLTRPVTFTPLLLLLVQGALRFCAIAYLLLVLSRHWNRTPRQVLVLGAVLAFDPQGLYLDHFLLADSLFLTLTIATVAGLLHALATPRAATIGLLALILALAVPVRFVGFAYPFLAIALILVGTRQPIARRLAQAGLIAAVTAAVVAGMSAHVNARYGLFAPTTFTGFAFGGTIGPMLDFDTWQLDDDAHPELALVHAFYASFPRDVYDEQNTNWHRWHPDSPTKQLHGLFLADAPEDSAAWARGREFLIGFMALSATPSTPAQRVFEAKRVRESIAPYQLDHRTAFVVTNSLLDRLSRAYIAAHPLEYIGRFYAGSVRRLFAPVETPIAHGRYTYREYPDGSVTRFWPGQETTEWRARLDIGERFRWVHTAVVPIEWLVVLVILVRRVLRDGVRAAFALPGTWLIGFAVAFGLVVAWTHMIEIRYVAPILVFALVGGTLLRPGR